MADAGKIVITPKGAYSSTKTYEWLDEVSYNGNAYVALKTVTGVTPSDDGVNWRLFMSSSDVDANVLVPKFTEASTRSNIVSGENLSTMFGKIKKWFTDLKSHAFKDLVNNLTTETTGSALDASQGKILKDEVDGVNRKLSGIEEGAEATAATISGSNPTVTNSTNAPLIYGKFGGYTLQDGEPTPDNPIDIQGLGDSGTIEVKTCGKNLIEKVRNGVYPLTSANGVLWAYEQACATEQYINVGFNKQYTLSCSLSNWTCNVACYDVNKGFVKNITRQKTFTIDDENIKYIRLGVWNNENVAFDDISVQLELGDTATDYEPYTETTATIPIDTLYEGDYLEVYADGSGKIYRVNKEIYVSELTIFFVGDTLTNTQMVQFNRPSDMKKRETKYYCDRFTYIKGTLWDNDTLGLCSSIEGANYDLMSFRIPVGSDGNVYFTDNPTKIVYPLENPIETPLTAKQVEQFKKLYTFDNVTNFFCDGEITARYYCNTDSGDTVGMLQKQAKENLEQIKNDLLSLNKTITETYTTNTDFSKIVGGTVSSAGLTNIEYTIPTEISSAGLGTQSNNSGTLVDALKKATSKITEFFGTLYDAVKVKYLGNIALNLTLPTADYDFNNFKGYDRYTLVFKGEDINHTDYIREVLTIHNVIPSSNYIEKVCLDITNKYEFEPFVSITQRSDTNTVLALMIFDLDGISKMVNNLSIDVYGEMD